MFHGNDETKLALPGAKVIPRILGARPPLNLLQIKGGESDKKQSVLL